MDFNERVIPGRSAGFLYKEALNRYIFTQKYVKDRKKVLDIGCGTGYGGAVLAQKGQVVGIDSDKEAIDFARKNYGNQVIFKLGMAENLEFKDNQFDLVCAFEVIEHLRNPKLMLKEARRILKKHGLFIISSPNRLFSSSVEKKLSKYHQKEYSYEEFLKILKSYFGKVNIYGQHKSIRAKKAIKSFMNSQKARENLVKRDIFGLRKFLPSFLRENMWRYVGTFFGRKDQEHLQVTDFPIDKKKSSQVDYFVAVCLK